MPEVIDSTGVMQISVREGGFTPFDDGEDMVTLVLDHVPLLVMTDNDFIRLFSVSIVDVIPNIFANNGPFDIWCHPDVFNNPLVNTLPVNDPNGKKITLLSRDIWLSTVAHTMQGVSLLVRNGFDAMKLMGLMPLCWQLSMMLTAPYSDFDTFLRNKDAENDPVWGPKAKDLLAYIFDLKEKALKAKTETK